MLRNKILLAGETLIVFRENFRIALQAIRHHRLRSFLTIFIIALGITSLSGILSSIDVVKYYLQENFALMGSNTFSIQNVGLRIQVGHQKNKVKRHQNISYREALAFKNRFVFPAYISVFYTGMSGSSTVQYHEKKTDPNVLITGADENYLLTSGLELAQGRNFSQEEVKAGRYSIIIGSEIKKVLFPQLPNPVGKQITIASRKYQITGVLKEKGSAFGSSMDRSCIIPLVNFRQNFMRGSARSYRIKVSPLNPEQMDEAISEATGLFRIIRNIPPGKENDFEIEKSDKLANMLIKNIRNIRIAAIFIGLITLLGAAIGLMNIMFVSVTERTKEIGIRKALGANSRRIKQQFLTEAVLIAQTGGFLGVILGVAISYIVSLRMKTDFHIPWEWIVLSLIISFITAISSAYYPAEKAANLNPVEALRYE